MIRTAGPADITALSRIHLDGWRAAYGMVADGDWLAGLTEDYFTGKWEGWLAGSGMNVLLAEEGGAAAAFCAFGSLQTAPPGLSPVRPAYTAEIYALYVLSGCRGSGMGARLLGAAAARLAEMKHRSLCLWVADRNKRACAFYEREGGQRIGRHEIGIGPSTVREACYGWRSTAGLLSKAV